MAWPELLMVTGAVLCSLAAPAASQAAAADFNLTDIDLDSLRLIQCGDQLTGSTANNPDIGGNSAKDELFRIRILGRNTVITIRTCDSSYDTLLRVLTTDGTDVYRCDDCGPCGTRTVILLNPVNDTHHVGDLSGSPGFSTGTGVHFVNGDYILLLEGFSSSSGDYIIQMDCSDSNGAPSAAPSAAPSNSPTTDPCLYHSCSADCQGSVFVDDITGDIVPVPGRVIRRTTTRSPKIAKSAKSPRRRRLARSIGLQSLLNDPDFQVGYDPTNDKDSDLQWMDTINMKPKPKRKSLNPLQASSQGILERHVRNVESGSGSGSGVGSGSGFWGSSGSGSGSGLPSGIEFECGWDSVFNLCVSGEETTYDEVYALLESTPGACSSYTYAPTAAPTAHYQHMEIEGSIECGEMISGSTDDAINVGGGVSNDHFYSMHGSHGSTVEFDTCGSGYDTWLRVLTVDGEDVVRQVLSCDDCQVTTCPRSRYSGVLTRIRLHFNRSIDTPSYPNPSYNSSRGHGLSELELPEGDYVLQLEGWSRSAGPYNLTMTCITGGPTAAPTAPTIAPSNAPTPFPSAAPTSQPTKIPTTWASVNGVEVTFEGGPFSSLDNSTQNELIAAVLNALFNGTITEDDVVITIVNSSSPEIVFSFQFNGDVSLSAAEVEQIQREEVEVTVGGLVFASVGETTTGSPNSGTGSSSDGDDDDDAGMIVGIVIAVLVALIILALLAWKFGGGGAAASESPRPRHSNPAYEAPPDITAI